MVASVHSLPQPTGLGTLRGSASLTEHTAPCLLWCPVPVAIGAFAD